MINEVNMKKIVLVMPNTHETVKLNVKKDPPIGILYIAAVLRKADFIVSIVDAFALNLTINETVELVMKENPDYVGISCNYSPLHNITLQISQEIKALMPELKIFVGGNHATASADKLLLQSSGNIDVICMGQGEITALSYVSSVENKMDLSQIQGIAYLEKQKVVQNAMHSILNQLDEIPFPAYDLIDMSIYDRYNIIASRGCPFSCTYCASNVILKRNVKYRSVENIADEIELLLTNYGPKMFWFSDDTFTANIKFATALMDEIERRKLEFEWSCLTRVNDTSIELLKKMKKNGCKYISYGIESGNDQMLLSMNKKITKAEIINTIALTKEAGIDVYTFFLIGYPGETQESVEDSFNLILESKPTGASFAIVIPLPGTEMWKILEERKLIDFESVKWDFLFAKTGTASESERYSAHLAATWCDISEDSLIALYERGNSISNQYGGGK